MPVFTPLKSKGTITRKLRLTNVYTEVLKLPLINSQGRNITGVTLKLIATARNNPAKK
jgi:hypothetical protein